MTFQRGSDSSTRCENSLDPTAQLCFGATSNAALPNQHHNDYATIARGMGLDRVFDFKSMRELQAVDPDALRRELDRVLDSSL